MLEGASNRLVLVMVAATALVASCTTTQEAPEPPGVGPLIDRLETDESQSIYGMAATATAESTKIATSVLEAGGNAIDSSLRSPESAR